MPYLNLARNIIPDALMGGSSYARFNNANAHIAVGDGDDAFAATQTGLQGSNVVRLPMEVGYPERDVNTLRFRAVADESTANFDWEEWGIANADTGGEFLNRRVQSLGSKASGTTWTITAELTTVLPE